MIVEINKQRYLALKLSSFSSLTLMKAIAVP